MQNIKDPKIIKNYYRLIIDLVNDSIVIFDMEGIITNINDNFSNMIDRPKEKIIGCHITDFLNENNKSIFLEHINKKDDKHSQHECTFLAKNGHRLNASVSTSPFYDEDGTYKGSLAVIMNIARLNQSEKAFENLKQDLKIKNAKIEELSATVKVLLENGDENKRKVEEQVLSNVRRLVEPYLNKLKMRNDLKEKHKIYLSILESNIKKITSQFSHKLSLDYTYLTKSELQIAELVRDGRSSKEIADIICISERTVDTHRNRIRKKLGITNRNNNLRSYLLSIQ